MSAIVSKPNEANHQKNNVKAQLAAKMDEDQLYADL